MDSEAQKRNEFLGIAGRMDQLLAPSLSQDWPNLPVTRAEGVYLYGADGRRYLDFTSGIAVTNVGHSHPRVLDAAQRQMSSMAHGAVGVTLHESLLRLCVALTEVLPSGMEMFFFGNSGAEAVEGAIKMARYVTGRPALIAFEGGFHGRTYGAASVTSVKSKYRLGYEPFLPGIYFAPYPYPFRCPLGDDPEAAARYSLESIQRLFDYLVPPSEVAAILVEPIQGEAGYVVPPASFLGSLRDLCDQHGILLILDEVQTGFGRTGEMFAAQALDVRPDVMAIAKGIASGFPLSATVSRRELMSQWHAGSHGTTFGGNPVSCAAALATLEVIRDENLLENCRRVGGVLFEGLKRLEAKYSTIGEARGLGLMVALEFVIPGTRKEPNPNAVSQVLRRCLERGLLAYLAGNKGHVIRLMPPLCLSREQAEEALAILDASIGELES